MIITTQHGLAVASLVIKYNNKSIQLKNVLLDTGCAVSVFDTDEVAAAGLVPDLHQGSIVCMTGVGGRGEYCIQQEADLLEIDNYLLYHFRYQLANIKEAYQFDAILGNDFLTASGLINWQHLADPNLLQVHSLNLTNGFVH